MSIGAQVHLERIERGTQLYHFSLDGVASVKSVDLSADSLMMVMGLDNQGKGAVVLFEASGASRMRHHWDHDKSVWAVRFSPNVQMIAAAGYDMCVTLYSVSTYTTLQKIKYTPLGGPAFIWSLAWSADSSRMALGCWNTYAYLYSCSQPNDSETPDRSPSPEGKTSPLTEISAVKRQDRV